MVKFGMAKLRTAKMRIRKMRGFLPALLFFLIFSGCANASWASAGKIIPPAGPDCPLEGKWEVLRELTAAEPGGAEEQELGDSAQFSAEALVFGGYIWHNPSYKIKRVKAESYLMTKYLPLSEQYVAGDRTVEIITVYAAPNFWGEFLKIDQTCLISFVQNKAFLLQKNADQADSFLAGTAVPDVKRDSKAGSSGVLLGLRIAGENGPAYQTLWVAADNRKLHPLLSSEGIFFPRNSGFWQLEVQEVSDNGRRKTILWTRDVSSRDVLARNVSLKNPEDQAAKGSEETGTRVINYISNDYVALEIERDGRQKLQILPVDNLSSSTGLKVSELIGDEGLELYINAAKQEIRALQEKGVPVEDVETFEDNFEHNFGLVRKNGHWNLMGRVNYFSGGVPQTKDFQLNMLLPANLVYYDFLCLRWQHIKDRVPDAVDAFTSPNKDIALIKTKSKLYVYAIRAEQLEGKPLAELTLKGGETVIMAEWATGSYVATWEKAFLANGAQTVSGA